MFPNFTSTEITILKIIMAVAFVFSGILFSALFLRVDKPTKAGLFFTIILSAAGGIGPTLFSALAIMLMHFFGCKIG